MSEIQGIAPIRRLVKDTVVPFVHAQRQDARHETKNSSLTRSEPRLSRCEGLERYRQTERERERGTAEAGMAPTATSGLSYDVCVSVT